MLKTSPPQYQSIFLPSQKHAVFQAKGKLPQSIYKTWDHIFIKWLPESEVSIIDAPAFEYFGPESLLKGAKAFAQIYIPILEKTA